MMSPPESLRWCGPNPVRTTTVQNHSGKKTCNYTPGVNARSLPSACDGDPNVTPDSFSDGGSHNSLIEAVKHANLMINAGATIIDIGGESTRPGAADVSVEEELARVIPVVEAIAQRFEVWISVDTSKAEVIRESARAGAHIINDIRSLTEPGALQAAAQTGLPVCLMHMQGQPKTMQEAPKYEDVYAEVDRFC